MAGEYDDYRQAVEAGRRAGCRRGRVPVWRKVLRILYWFGAPLCLAVLILLNIILN